MADGTGSETPLLPRHHGSTMAGKTWSGETAPPDNPPVHGTVHASAINLSACALGASMLSLPYAMLIAGPIAALEFLVLFAVMAYASAQAIVAAGIASKKSTYSTIVHHYYGRVCSIFVDILLSVALVVAAISYIVGLADLLPGMLPFMGVFSRAMRIVITLVVLFPVTLTGSLAAFGPASSLAVSGCYILAIALVIQTVTSPADAWVSPPLSVWTGISFSGLAYSLPMICFVYAFHYVQTDTLAELNEPVLPRLTGVSRLTVYILLICYIPVSVCGYLLQSGGIIPGGATISSNILADLPPTSATVLIAKWAIGALLLITYSLFIIPLRRKVETLAFGRLSSAFLDPHRLVVAATLNIVVGIVSILLPDLGFANTLAGGCIALIMFFFPGLFMVQMQLDKSPSDRNTLQLVFGAMFIFCGVLICFVGLFGSLVFDY